MEKESKRLIVILGIIVLVIVGIVVLSMLAKTKSKNIVLKVQELKSSADISAVYIMRDDCQYCELNKSNMELIKGYGFEPYVVNTNELTENDLNDLMSTLDIDPNNFGTPRLVVVGNNNVVDTLSGLSTFNGLFNFVKDNKLISSDSKLYLNYIDYSGYKKLIKSESNEVIVLATSSCKLCLAEHSILNEIAKETGAKINYMYLDYAITSPEEYDGFMSSMDWFNDNSEFVTSINEPITLVVKNKKVVLELSGYRDKDEVISFYKDNGIIK